MIWINVNRVGIFVIQNYRICAPKIFNFKTIFALSISENVVASKVFILTFCCAISRQAPVGKIQRPSDGVKYVAVAHTVKIWDCGHNGPLWVYPSVVVNIKPGSGNISTTIQTPEGEVVLITVSRYGCLVRVKDGCLDSGVRPILYVSPERV